MYINDMYKSSNQVCFVHFADDTTIFASDGDINNVHVTSNMELVGVNNWLKANGHSLNASKTSCMMISNQKNSCDNIKICDSILTKFSANQQSNHRVDSYREFIIGAKIIYLIICDEILQRDNEGQQSHS